jgi:hypothetical protein
MSRERGEPIVEAWLPDLWVRGHEQAPLGLFGFWRASGFLPGARPSGGDSRHYAKSGPRLA